MHTHILTIISFTLLSAFPCALMGQTWLEQMLQQTGEKQENIRDWSSETFISIPEPRCAYVNITGIKNMPVTRSANMEARMEVYDGNGNYFAKSVILNDQGNSTRRFPKKSFKAAFFENLAEGTTSDLRIGEWLKQDVFHFKAYYTDFFRGIGVVGYKLYDQIATNRGRMWTRAALKNPNPYARCYPDGFPCKVYLNGEFHGLYAWQLKKNRRNMNMEKDVAEHIHLDGTISDAFLWNGNVNWTQFEVRNPKVLYVMNGSAYNGDSPTELLDETSAYFDLPGDDEEVRINKRKTAAVKHYIQSFSNFFAQIQAMEQSGVGNSAIRQALADRLDIPSLIDYLCFYYITNNYDGLWKNWQWFTYDGIKWFVAPYDLDATFGNHASGRLLLPPEWSCEGVRYTAFPTTSRPVAFLLKYYREELKERWAELRNNQIFSLQNLTSLIDDWYNHRIGEDLYLQEWQRWPESQCISQTVCSDNWETIDDWVGYGSMPTYDENVTYHAGDKCKLASRVWIATGETQGVLPYLQIGYTDSFDRICQWVARRMELIDNLLEYQPEADGLPELSLAEPGQPAPYVIARYNLNGQPLDAPQKGVNILRMSDGTVRKVLCK